MFDIVARTNLGPLEKYPQKLMDAISKVVRATAFRIERDAKLAPFGATEPGISSVELLLPLRIL